MKFDSYKISDLISEIAMGPFGSNIKVDCFVDHGIPVLNGSNLDGFELKEDSFRFVTEEKADSLKRSNAYRGDVVITHRGTLGQISYIPVTSQYDRYVISQSQFRIRCNEKILPEYLVYYFHTKVGQYQLLSNASQVGVPALARPTSTFQQLEIVIPEIEIQKKIVNILNALQSKIKINQKINENLERQAQAIFESWFTDKKEVNGCLADICQYSKEKVAVSSLDLDCYYSTENMLPGKAGATQAASLPTTAHTIKCNVGNVLISNIRPYFKKIVYCYADCGCSTDVLCFAPKKQELSAYLFFLLYADSFFDFMVAGSKGTKMPRGDKQQIMMYPVYVPSDEELTDFNSFAQPTLKQVQLNREENKRLIALRDTLLPKLMSGELDVSSLPL